MNPQPPKPAKICKHCGRDCTRGTRFRDARGQYVCGECEALLRAGAAAVESDSTGDVADGSGGTEEAGVPIEATEIDGGVIPLVDDESPPVATGRACDNCGAPMSGNIICIRCGFNSTTGALMGGGPPPGSARVCRKCGYSLEGLRTMQCPECGTFNGRRSRRELDRELQDHFTRVDYVRPAIMVAVGLPLTLLINLAAVEGASNAGVYLLSYFASIPVGILAYFLCCLVWLGFDAPLHLTALRLAGVYTLSDAAAAILGHACFIVPIPILFGPWFVGLIIYIALLADTLDLEVQDAVMAGLVTFAVKLGALMGLLYLLGGLPL